MNKLSRRSFVKRTGAATIGSALGLGLLPSLTRKLYAVDSSTASSGVAAYITSPVVPVTVPVNGGLLTLTITQSCTAAPGVCVNSLCVTVKRNARFTKTVSGKNYVGDITRTDSLYWRCESGVATLFYASHSQPVSAPIANVTDPADTRGVVYPDGVTSEDQKTSGLRAKIFDNTTGEWSDWSDFGTVSYVVYCCSR